MPLLFRLHLRLRLWSCNQLWLLHHLWLFDTVPVRRSPSWPDLSPSWRQRLPTRHRSPMPERLPIRDRGQATTEYALVMLGAAVVALLVVSWATSGGGAGRVGRLFDRVIDAVAGRI